MWSPKISMGDISSLYWQLKLCVWPISSIIPNFTLVHKTYDTYTLNMFSSAEFYRYAAKFCQNRSKSVKIGQNRSKSAKIGHKSVKIGQNRSKSVKIGHYSAKNICHFSHSLSYKDQLRIHIWKGKWKTNTFLLYKVNLKTNKDKKLKNRPKSAKIGTWT